MSAAATAARRAELLERCESERNELIAMTSAARAAAPRVQAWMRAARTFWRLLRALAARTRNATGGN